MGRRTDYDVAELFRLWRELSLTRAEVARQIGVSEQRLSKLAERHGLGPRGRQHRAYSMDDPTPEEIAERARECRERHYAQRRAETATATDSKLSKRRARECLA